MTDDSANTIVDRSQHLPFGGMRSGSSNYLDDVTSAGYTGHKENSYIKLQYMNVRYYVPYLNRFVSPDTIVPDPNNPQSFNRCAYVNNNPINYTDPTRHDALGGEWVDEFTRHHGRAPDARDEWIRLFSIAYPDEYAWIYFYNDDGSYREGSIDFAAKNPAPDRSWDTFPDAMGRLSKAYTSES